MNVQLIDAAVGNHLWAERHDRELAEIFDLQEDITDNVIAAVGSQILVAEATRARRKPTHSIDAWDLVIQAVPHMWRMNTQEHRRAEELLQQAIVLDSHYAHAYALLGWTYITMFNLDTRRPIGEFTGKALDAVALDDQNPWGHLVFGLGHARFIRAGTLRLLGVTAPQRTALLPHAPTVSESGVPGFDAMLWNGFFVPAGTPKAIVELLNSKMNGVLSDAQVKDAFEKLGIEPMGGAPSVLAGRVQTETRKWIDIAREKRIQVE